jgi:hypothetical protein
MTYQPGAERSGACRAAPPWVDRTESAPSPEGAKQARHYKCGRPVSEREIDVAPLRGVSNVSGISLSFASPTTGGACHPTRMANRLRRTDSESARPFRADSESVLREMESPPPPAQKSRKQCAHKCPKRKRRGRQGTGSQSPALALRACLRFFTMPGKMPHPAAWVELMPRRES